MHKATIKSPVATKTGKSGVIDVTGQVAYLTFGSRKRFKVLIQDEPAYLLDYRSGQCIPSALGGDGRLTTEATYIMAAKSMAHDRSPRACAQLRLDMILERKTEAAIFAVLDAAPALNK